MSTRLTALIGLVLIGVLVVALLSDGAFQGPDSDRRQISRERAKRLETHDALASLPVEPDHPTLNERLAKAGFEPGSRVFVRIFKLEFELEVWLERGGAFHLFATYPICRWSGELGPKIKEGDKQAPEGFYTVDASQLNPASRWHRSFNLGFPNAFDRGRGRTGTFLMVHGGCSSAGCYAMTDAGVDEIWRIVTRALVAGQPRFHVHIFPFRMTAKALARRRAHKAYAFWQGLAPGFAAFEASRVVPVISHCNGSYVVEPGAPGPLLGAEPLLDRCPDREIGGPDPLPVPSAAASRGQRRL